ncbi:hypothetical protein Syun_022269 [Stephania yunnanensis]|uniref:Uncharacterized protein n=1 Tax=Stephania yunnanensis TaxID=152371 RepID=A0AAP0HYE0_9MAGN
MRPATKLRVFSLHHKSTAAAAAVVKSKSSLSAQTTTTEVVCDAHFAASDDYSSSHRLKPPIKKISKDERRSLLQAFVLQYKASNEANSLQQLLRGSKSAVLTMLSKEFFRNYNLNLHHLRSMLLPPLTQLQFRSRRRLFIFNPNALL